MKKTLLLSLTLALSATATMPLTAQNQESVRSVQDRTVGKIDVKIENLPKGESFDRQSITAKLRTREGDPFSQFVFDQDLKQLAGEYDRVVPVMQVDGNDVNITLKVWLRPVIHSIDWDGNTHIKTKALKKELDIKPGTVFNRTEFNKAFNKLKELYIKKGYFESQLSYRLVPIEGTQEVNVVIKIDEGRSGKVESIEFHGFSKKEESTILHKLYTKKHSTLTSWFTGKGKFNEEALEQDRLTIFNYLQDEGYADARVQIKILESKKDGKIIVDISADKGPLYHFGQVSFEGNILFSDEEVEKVFSARPEGVYSPDKLRKTADAIKELYGRKGFIDTSVTYETQLVRNAPVYNVHFSVSEGEEYRIGMIRIIGNVQTESRVILRESLLVPGETFDSLKLKVTQMRLEGIGYFKSVNVYAVRTQDDLSLGDNYRDIYIEVEEAQTGSISLFSGFSSADNVFGGLDLTESNFNISGLGSMWGEGLGALRGGGEYLRMRGNVGKTESSFIATWMTPYLNDSKWRLGLEYSGTFNNRRISDEFRLGKQSGGIFVNYPLTAYWTYGLKYNLNFERTTGAKKEIKDQIENTHAIVSTVGTNLTYNSLDRAIKPHRGLRTVLEADFAGVGGDVMFLRTSYLNAYYTPLWQRGYMRYRWEFRNIVPLGFTPSFADIPENERYFLGGSNSVRGYTDFSLGPSFDIVTSDGDKKFSPQGGISSSLLSIEYIQEIFPFLDAFAFIDSGYVNSNVFGFGTYRFSYGVGVNIEVLGRMPITLGYGIPVNPKNKDQVQNFFFSLGGQF